MTSSVDKPYHRFLDGLADDLTGGYCSLRRALQAQTGQKG